MRLQRSVDAVLWMQYYCSLLSATPPLTLSLLIGHQYEMEPQHRAGCTKLSQDEAEGKQRSVHGNDEQDLLGAASA